MYATQFIQTLWPRIDAFVSSLMILVKKKTWVYILKEKLEVFSDFKKFNALVEMESGHNIKAMRFDKGGWFISKEFEKYCENYGIHSPLATAYSPHKNGVVKRKNRVILDMTQTCWKVRRWLKNFGPK